MKARAKKEMGMTGISAETPMLSRYESLQEWK